MRTYSQAGQDIFAWQASRCKRDGTFLDYGCNDPFIHNNTAALEEMGWTGICIDIVRFNYSRRKAKFIQHDASSRISEVEEFCQKWEGFVDYLSLDVDDATLGAMRVIPFDKCRFGAITVEHDSYRIGPGIKDWVKGYLISKGYELFREDIKAPISPGMPWSGQPFEDWYISIK